MVSAAPLTLLVLMNLFLTSADNGGSSRPEEDRPGPCTASLTPEGICSRHGQDRSTCPYRFDIPPLTVHLPNQLRELKEILKDLQDLKDNVDELRKMCVDCNSGGKECGSKDDSGTTEGGRHCGKATEEEAEKRTITEGQEIDTSKEVKESDGMGLVEKGDARQGSLGEKIKPDGADRKDKWEQTKPPVTDGNKRQEELEKEMNLDKNKSENLDLSAGKETELDDGEKVEKLNNSNVRLLVESPEEKERIHNETKMREDKNEHMNKPDESDGAEKREEMGKSSKEELNNEKPNGVENAGHAGKPIKELDPSRGRIKTEDEKTPHGWTERESDGELTSSGAIERTDFVSISPSSPSAVGPAQRKYSTVLDQAVTITSSLPSTPASRSTSDFMRGLTHGGEIISSAQTPLREVEVTQLMFTSTHAKNTISQTTTTDPSTLFYTTTFSHNYERRTEEPKKEGSQGPEAKPETQKFDSKNQTEEQKTIINEKQDSPPDLVHPDHTKSDETEHIHDPNKFPDPTPVSTGPTVPSTLFYTTTFSHSYEKRTEEPKKEGSQGPEAKPETEKFDSKNQTEEQKTIINEKQDSTPDLVHPDHTKSDETEHIHDPNKFPDPTPASTGPTVPSTLFYTTTFSHSYEKRTEEPKKEGSQVPEAKPETEKFDSKNQTEEQKTIINEKQDSPPGLVHPDHTKSDQTEHIHDPNKFPDPTPVSTGPTVPSTIFDSGAQTRSPELTQGRENTASDKSPSQPGQNNIPGSYDTQLIPEFGQESNKEDSLPVTPKPDQDFEDNKTHHRSEDQTTSVSGQVAGSDSSKPTEERPTPEPQSTAAGRPFKHETAPEAEPDSVQITAPFTTRPETQTDGVTQYQEDTDTNESPNSRISSDLMSQTSAPPPSISETTRPNKIHRGNHQIPDPSVPDAEPSSQAKIYQSEEGVMKTSPEAKTTSTLRNPIMTTTLSTFDPQIPAAVSSTPRTRELREKINQVAAFLNNSLSPHEGPAGRFPKDHREDSKVPIPSKVPTVRRDCSDHLLRGKTKGGVYLVTPDLRSRSFHVLCDMKTAGGGWTVLQQRQDGSVSFNRTWAEYKAGFGEIRGGEFWLGNNLIHWLTRDRDMVLRVELEDFEGVKGHAEYQQFSVASERMRYRLTVGDYSGTAGDALRSGDRYDHNNRAFTTPDRDHDRYQSGNCGAYYSSGWWFNACMAANLNGRYYERKYKGVRDGIFWGTWYNVLNEFYPTNDRRSFKRVRMMTRPHGFAM